MIDVITTTIKLIFQEVTIINSLIIKEEIGHGCFLVELQDVIARS